MRRLAIYPGSFDPPTLGHLDVIHRAAELFDELVVAVGINSNKRPFLTTEQKVEALRLSTSAMANVRVDAFEGLLVDYVKKMDARVVVRGLRATADFEYEFQMAIVNRRLDSNIDTVFLMTKWEHSYLSSSIVREVASLGGDYSEMVSSGVAQVMRKALIVRPES